MRLSSTITSSGNLGAPEDSGTWGLPLTKSRFVKNSGWLSNAIRIDMLYHAPVPISKA
jgi:hypothetical protein